MDKIIIKDLRANGIIGIYDQERIIPQEMLVNLTLQTDTRKAGQTDDIANCVDYEKIANKIRHHAETAKRLTVEALAEDFAQICLSVPGVQSVRICVEKTEAIPFTASVGVEIERSLNK